MDNHYKKIKISFSVIILLLIAGIAGGGFIMKGNNSFSIKQLVQTINYLNYKSSFVYANDKNLTAAVISIFDSSSVIINNNNDAKSVPVLLYHSIIGKPDGANVLLENFKDQMFALKKAGWQTVSIEDFYGFMQGKNKLPEKSFLLTFDDGAKNSYYPVDPILKALDYKAVTFIITKYSVGKGSGSSYYLSNNELEKMVKSGRWDIQAHSREGHNFYSIDDKKNQSHFFGNKLWIKDEKRVETDEEFKTRIYNDFVVSKNDLENEFGIKVISFAYPFGDFGQNSINFPEAKSVVLNTVKSVYPMSFYQVWGGNPKTNYPQSDTDHLFIKRIEVKPQWNDIDLLTVLEKSRDKDLPHYDDLAEDKGWQKGWGNMDFKDGSMVVGANASTTGSVIFLDGTYLWQDYIFNADTSWIKGQALLLMARYKDDENYIACSFNDKSLKIEQYLNGKKRIMAEKDTFFEMPKENLQLGVMVNKDKVECLVNGNSVIYTYYLSPALTHGGIGFKTWDSEINNSEVVVKNVDVTEIIGDEKSVLAQLPKIELTLKEISKKKQSIVAVVNIEKPKTVVLKSVSIAPTKPLPSPIPLMDVSGVSTPYTVNDLGKSLGNWSNISGSYFVKDNFLHLTSNASTTAGRMVLGGTSDWKDYSFKTIIDWSKGDTVTLLARYKDPRNYTGCTFSYYGAYARVFQMIDGKKITLGKTGRMPISYNNPWLDNNLSVQVNGDEIQCLVNDQWVLRYNLSKMPTNGGVGIEVWDPERGNGEITLKELKIEQITQ